MEKSIKKYIQNLGIISLLLLVISVPLYLTLLKPWFNYVFPFVILYFFLLSSFQHYKLIKTAKDNPRVFNTNYMAWFGLKLFLHLSFVIIYVLINRSQALSFVLFFGFCYVVYTAFDVVSLSNTLRSGNVK
jgi:L-asparagine transporter-like permease